MKGQVAVNIANFDYFPLKKLANIIKKIFTAIVKIDTFVVNCLDANIAIIHRVSPDSSFDKITINYFINTKMDFGDQEMEIVTDYVDKSRHLLFDMLGHGNVDLDGMIREMTPLAIDVDEKINKQRQIFDHKIINRVAMATVAECISMACINRKEVIPLKVSSREYSVEIEKMNKLDAVEMLGGKSISDISYSANFLAGKINFENIEKRADLILDGRKVPAFFTDKKWIAKFNAGKIKLAKNDRIRSKCLIEQSPISKHPVYYLVKIEGVNI